MFDGKEESVKVEDERTGVPTEVRAWGDALAKGVRNEKKILEEALADLELLEPMVRGGDEMHRRCLRKFPFHVVRKYILFFRLDVFVALIKLYPNAIPWCIAIVASSTSWRSA